MEYPRPRPWRGGRTVSALSKNKKSSTKTKSQDKARRKLNTNQIKSEDIAPATDTTRLHHCNA